MGDDWYAAIRTDDLASLSIQLLQRLIDLRQGGDRGPAAGTAARTPQNNGGGQRSNVIRIRSLQALQEPPRRHRERLHESTLAFRGERLNGQAGLPGAADTSDHDQRLFWQVNTDALQILYSNAAQ